MPGVSLKALSDLSNSNNDDGRVTDWNSQNSFIFKLFIPRRSCVSTSLVDAPLTRSLPNPIHQKVTFLAFNMPAPNPTSTKAVVSKYSPRCPKSPQPRKKTGGGRERVKTLEKNLISWHNILAYGPDDLRGMNVCQSRYLLQI